MGTHLQSQGLGAGEAPESWVLQRPETILNVHREYVRAGAEAVITCTFGANRWRLKGHGLGEQTGEINRQAAELAREAVGRRGFVLGNIGPTGELMSPLGSRDASEFEEVFLEQASALANAGVDGILIETMTAVEEAVAALVAAKEATEKPVLVSMQFNPDADGKSFHTVMGADIPTSVRRLTDARADGIGTNCVPGMAVATRIVRQMRQLTRLPIVAEPNAGLPRLEGGRTVYDETPEAFAAGAVDLASAGANLIGGCCGTTPEHIRRLAKMIEE